VYGPEAMDFPDPFAEDVPEQDLLLSSWPGETFDDYWGELEDRAVGTSDSLAGGSLPAFTLRVSYQQRLWASAKCI